VVVVGPVGAVCGPRGTASGGTRMIGRDDLGVTSVPTVSEVVSVVDVSETLFKVLFSVVNKEFTLAKSLLV